MDIRDPSVAQTVMPALERIGTRLLRSVVPLFAEEGHRPCLIGSGLLVDGGSQQFVISAAHVFRDVCPRPLFLSFGGSRIFRMTDRVLLTAPEDDGIDLAVAPVVGVDRREYLIVEKEPLHPAAIASAPALPSEAALYMVSGYPASRSGPTNVRDNYQVTPYSYTNCAAQATTYDRVGANEESHLVLTFNRKKSVGRAATIQSFPKPTGISGAPVWLLADKPVVVGIATRWVDREKVIVSTRVELAKSILTSVLAES